MNRRLLLFIAYPLNYNSTKASSSDFCSIIALSTSSLAGFFPVNNHLKLTLVEFVKYNNSGKRNSVINVEIKIPYAIEIAIGIKNWAVLAVSKIRGPRPSIVVIEVRKIARNLDRPASYKASLYGIPSFK